MAVVLDLTVGEARVGRATLHDVTDASAVAPGAVRLSNGVVIAPLAFGARSTACALHADARRLGAAVLALSRSRDDRAGERSRSTGAPAVEALALHLAGARLVDGGPSFGDAAVAMSRVFGWDIDRVVGCSAHVIDHLATSVLEPGDGEAGEDGWRSFVLVPAPADDDPAEVRDRLAADLLRRAVGRSTRRLSPVEEPADWIDGDLGSPCRGDRPVGSPSAAIDPRPGWVDPVASASRSGSGAPWAPALAGLAAGAKTWSARGHERDLRTTPPRETPGPRTVLFPQPTITPDRSRELGRSDGALEPAAHGLMWSGVMDFPMPQPPPTACPPHRTRWADPTRDWSRPERPRPLTPVPWGDGSMASADEATASIADRLAVELDDESDLRGVLRW